MALQTGCVATIVREEEEDQGCEGIDEEECDAHDVEPVQVCTVNRASPPAPDFSTARIMPVNEESDPVHSYTAVIHCSSNVGKSSLPSMGFSFLGIPA